jgi:hypothetical protein
MTAFLRSSAKQQLPRHLADEEDLVIPAMLEHVKRATA